MIWVMMENWRKRRQLNKEILPPKGGTPYHDGTGAAYYTYDGKDRPFAPKKGAFRSVAWDIALMWCVTVIPLLALAAGVWVGASMMEARTFNKLTGQNVTTWDAMWTTLRIMDTPIKH